MGITEQERQMNYRGFMLDGQSGDWTAYSSDVTGWGKTKDAAVEAALRERRGLREEGEQMAAEDATGSHPLAWVENESDEVADAAAREMGYEDYREYEKEELGID